MLFEGYTGGGSKDAIDGLMATGDVGRIDDAGRLFVEGRDDEMIVSGGENLFPKEVEDILARHSDVAEVAAIGVDDEKFGQRLRAFVVTNGSKKGDEDALKKHVKSNLANFKVPREIWFLDELPRNATGKVLKRELKEIEKEPSMEVRSAAVRWAGGWRGRRRDTVLAAAPAAAGEDPPFIDWNPLLPGLAQPFHPSRERDCADGSPSLRRGHAVADVPALRSPVCHLRSQRGVRHHLHPRDRGDPQGDPRRLLRGAGLPLPTRTGCSRGCTSKATTRGRAGSRELVPPAWREAYDAGRDRYVNGTGNLLMSMNAHINRDFPFLLDALGLIKPDGSTRKADHDRGNVVLNRLYGPVLKELSERFDPVVDDTNAPGATGDDTAIVPDPPGLARGRVAQRRAPGRGADARGAQGRGRLHRAVCAREWPASSRRRPRSRTPRRATPTARRTGEPTGRRVASRAQAGASEALRAGARSVRVSCRLPRGAARLRRDGHARAAPAPAHSPGARLAARGQVAAVTLRLTRPGRRVARLRGGAGCAPSPARPSPWSTTRTAAVRMRLRG